MCLQGPSWPLPSYLLQHTNWVCGHPSVSCNAQGGAEGPCSPVLPWRSFPPPVLKLQRNPSQQKRGEKRFFRDKAAVPWPEQGCSTTSISEIEMVMLQQPLEQHRSRRRLQDLNVPMGCKSCTQPSRGTALPEKSHQQPSQPALCSLLSDLALH